MSAQFKAPQQTLNSDSTNTLNSKQQCKCQFKVVTQVLFDGNALPTLKKITLGEDFSGL